MKQDALQMSLLFDYYGELLSEKQRVCFDLYYNQDLSLSEIASELGITRQASTIRSAGRKRRSASLSASPAASRATGARQRRWRQSQMRASGCNRFPRRARQRRTSCSQAQA